MSKLRTCPHQHPQIRQKFEDKFRALENELRQKNDTIDILRNDIASPNQKNDLSRAPCIPSTTQQMVVCNTSQRTNVNSNWNILIKDREIAKLKGLIFQKDSELIELISSNKNALLQMEERMERERKLWNEHKELLLAGERAKFEEEKIRLYKNLQDQLKHEQERCQRLEKKLYDAQMQSSEAQLILKENGRERINAIYNMKEQCRKEFHDEVSRLHNQFQMEKVNELTRVQQRMHELENTLDRLSNENADASACQQELILKMETSEKACVRLVHDSITKLLMAMDSSSHTYTKIPQVTSFTYDREALIERLPTRNVLKLLEDTIEDIRNYIMEQKIQIEVKRKSKTTTDQSTDYPDRTHDDANQNHCQQTTNSLLKQEKENNYYVHDIDLLSKAYDKYHSQNKSRKPFQLSSQQNNTIDNLVQKLENHIAYELDRVTKQRLTLNSANHYDDLSMLYHSKVPKKVFRIEEQIVHK
ncbi:unnamed protein product [Adineta steineri]|uniref:Uncharacterized protein n=1 Tax=Adineta steineri TaxID=433720 RepID=A0A813TIU9_9BILA|nr:unnamed protein product [Adineta steineri]CAF3489782.1 unnamed protein product [Adineta steineri]